MCQRFYWDQVYWVFCRFWSMSILTTQSYVPSIRFIERSVPPSYLYRMPCKFPVPVGYLSSIVLRTALTRCWFPLDLDVHLSLPIFFIDLAMYSTCTISRKRLSQPRSSLLGKNEKRQWVDVRWLQPKEEYLHPVLTFNTSVSIWQSEWLIHVNPSPK